MASAGYPYYLEPHQSLMDFLEQKQTLFRQK